MKKGAVNGSRIAVVEGKCSAEAKSQRVEAAGFQIVMGLFGLAQRCTRQGWAAPLWADLSVQTPEPSERYLSAWPAVLGLAKKE